MAALNQALRDIPPERVRLHMCWGNYEGPHHRDVPLRDVLDIVLGARAQTISFEGANPRHGHEWALFTEITLPDDKLIMPGVIDSTTHYVEHPELVAQRIEHYADAVGRSAGDRGDRLRHGHLRHRRRRAGRPSRLGQARARWSAGRARDRCTKGWRDADAAHRRAR